MGSTICAGIATTTGCTLAQAPTLITGMFVEEVFIVICPCTFPASSGGTVLTTSSNCFPG